MIPHVSQVVSSLEKLMYIHHYFTMTTLHKCQMATLQVD